MKVPKNLLLASVILATLIGCGSSKETSKTESSSGNQSTENTASQASTTDNAMNQTQETKYRLVISFISIGEGTDPDARKIMDGVIAKWENKTGKKIEMETYPWGREGEADFCFHLKELSASEQASFIEEMRKAMDGRSLIQMSENQKSMNKR